MNRQRCYQHTVNPVGKLTDEALYDALTLLPSRKLFQERAGRSLLQTKRDKDYLFAVLFLDLDRFRVVNEGMGHDVGDRLLIEVGQRLERSIRAVDSAARFGGDKYIILLDDIRNPGDAVRVAERIQKKLQTPIRLNGHDIFPGACIGISLSSHGYSGPEELLRDAEIAMYRAKQQGTGQYAIFDIAMHEDGVKLLRLESDMRRALDRNELRLHYPPIVSLETRRIAGFEALVRWQHPDRGLLYPSELLPLAEEAGLIIPISASGGLPANGKMASRVPGIATSERECKPDQQISGETGFGARCALCCFPKMDSIHAIWDLKSRRIRSWGTRSPYRMCSSV